MTIAERVVVCAPAKVNLCLHVGARRADGYHDLESLVAFVEHGDRIRLAADTRLSMSVSGPFGAGVPSGEDNLALRAARLLASKIDARTGARISVRKNIPIAAGLGGGSADAAAVLRGLIALWNPEPDRQALYDIAASLGADVPICVTSATAWIEKRGEKITALPPLPKLWLLLVNPGVPLSTASVFAKLDRRRGLGLACPREAFADAQALVRFLASTGNDLQRPACALAPVIAAVLEELERLPGVLLARMSGSGATCFGLFATRGAARAAATGLKNCRPGWWIVDTAVATGRTVVPLPDQ